MEEECSECHQTEPCDACYKKVLTELARLTVLQHLLASAVCLFNFEFIGVFVEICWAVERLFKVGDYTPGGKFDKMGIDWRKPL